MDNNWKNPNFLTALKNAINGIKYNVKTSRNFKIQLVFAFLVTVLCIFLKLSITEVSIIVLTISIVLITEMINTAIETTIDMYTTEYNGKAKIAKDVAAGAVTISAIASIIVGILIFLPKILDIMK